MVQKDSKVMVPPKLLAGAVVLYWGAMVGLPFIALVMAILLEARNWIDFRWKISEKGYVKAFYVTLFLIAVALLLIRLDDVDITSFSKIIRWSPIFAMPIELAQRYWKSDRMYLNTFFYFSRQRMINDRKEGRPINPNVINTGYPYLIGVLISATCTDRQDWLVSVGMLVIVLAILFSVIIERKMRWQRLVWMLPLLLVLTLAARAMMDSSYAEVVKIRTGAGNYKSSGSYDALSARLGSLGEVKQSSEIQWRIWSDGKGDPPAYVHTGIYNKFARMRWRYDYKSANFKSLAAAFDSGAGVKKLDSEDNTYVFKDSDISKISAARNANDLRKLKIRGMGDTKTTESIVPAVLGFKAVSNIASDDTLPTMNPMGVIKLVDRKVIIDYQLWRTESLDELTAPPVDHIDLRVDREYENVIDLLVNEIKLNKYQTTVEKVEAIRLFFTSKFKYALHFDNSDDHFSGNDLERFMIHDRRGHCEYFATTTALMLRRVGVPVRYAVGYVVREEDGEQWIIRGTHGHAWCHVWIDGKWQNVDLTPPDWLSMENVDKDLGGWHRFTDGFQQYREDFQAWKSQKGNESTFNKGLVAVGVLLLVWFGFRIWRKRLCSNAHDSELNYKEYNFSKEIEQMIKQWQDKYGERPPGLTLRQWFENHSDELSSSDLAETEIVINRHELSRFGSG